MTVVNARNLLDKNLAWGRFKREYEDFDDVVQYIEKKWMEVDTERRFNF